MTAESIRLWGAEQRYRVVDEFPAEGYTQPTDGTKPKRYGYQVVIVGRDEVRERKA